MDSAKQKALDTAKKFQDTFDNAFPLERKTFADRIWNLILKDLSTVPVVFIDNFFRDLLKECEDLGIIRKKELK
jgi:hypothetical protein